MTRMTFLGTGGGRFAAILQARATGGLYIEVGERGPDGDAKESSGQAPMNENGKARRFHIDPGPGALVRMLARGLSPLKTDAILISHCHPDHYGDAEILIEGMTDGGNKRQGALVASRSVLEGVPQHGPAISKYHAAKPGLVKAVAPGDSVDLFGTRVDATAVAHSDPSAVGFLIHTDKGAIGYVSDTALDGKVAKAHAGSRVLILPVTRPLGARIPFHLTVEDAAQLASEIRPELALLNHFGMRVIREGPEKSARWIEEKTGVRTLAAHDGMELEIGKELEPRTPPLQATFSESAPGT